MVKSWCKHIKYSEDFDYWKEVWTGSYWGCDIEREIPKKWKFCPICGAKRPKIK